MRLPFLSPGDVVRATEQGYAALERAIGLVPRLVTAVTDVEQLLARVSALVGRIEQTERRADAVVSAVHKTDERAAAVVAEAATVAVRAATVVDDAVGITARIDPLLQRWEPLLTKLAPVADKLEPLLNRLANTTSPAEVDALVGLVDRLPDLLDRLERDVLPVLDTLGTVAPDLRELLDSTKEFNEILSSLPGLGRIKRRVEERLESAEAAQEHLADEQPQTAPARQT